MHNIMPRNNILRLKALQYVLYQTRIMSEVINNQNNKLFEKIFKTPPAQHLHVSHCYTVIQVVDDSIIQ
jgi:hypothetical protein